MPNSLGGKTKDPELGRICNEFNKNKSREEFTRLCDMNPEYDNRKKCRICGGDIFYRNVLLKGPFQEYPTISQGTSFLSKKKINDIVYELSVCEDCMAKEFEEYEGIKNKSRIFNMPNKYSKFAFNISDGDLEYKKKELCVRSEESFIKKYGEINGRLKWKEYVEKERYTASFEYMCEKHGMSKEDFEKFNKSRACTLENMISRYGEEEGLIKWNAYVNRQRYTTTREYFINEYGEEEGEIKWNNFNLARMDCGPYSKISQELFETLKNEPCFIGHNIKYATFGSEKEVFTKEGNLYYLDYYDEDIKVCVEFNGIAYHPKPGKYKENDVFKNPFGKEILVKDVWDKESKRIEELMDEFGIKTFVVWEDDYKNSKERVIKELLNDIKNYTNGL